MDRIILLISLFIQAIGFVIALIYIRKMPKFVGILILLVFSFMLLRGFLNLFGFFKSEVSELLILLISLFIFLSIIGASSLYKDFNRLLKQLKGLWEIDRVILSGLTPKSIMGGIKRAMIELIDCDGFGIYTYDQAKNSFNLYEDYNLNEKIHKNIMEKENGILWKIIRDRKNVIVPNSRKDSDFSIFLKSQNYSSFLGIPLYMKSNSLGALVLLSNKKGYPEKDIKFIEGVSRQVVIALDKIQTIERIKEMNIESVLALVQAIESRDPCTKGHSLKVANLAQNIARVLAVSEKDLVLIEFAGLLHDVGKIAVPEPILQKPGPLNSEEWVIMKRHPLYSAEIIKPVRNLSEIVDWIKYHHERWDGSGYPEGLMGDAIPVEARILAICDAYSAMTEKRPYRNGFTKEQALEEILKFSGKQFDPELVEIFLNHLGDPS
ncbi:MAG: HD domain-containing phosphohydrolase [bacterium]